MPHLVDWDDTPLAAGLECAVGATLGVGAFYAGKYLLFVGDTF